MGLKTGEKIKKKKYDDTLLLWMIPLFCAVAVFCYGPLFGWIYAFFEYQPGKPLAETSFVGLKYFIAMFTSTKDAMTARDSLPLLKYAEYMSIPRVVRLFCKCAVVVCRQLVVGVTEVCKRVVIPLRVLVPLRAFQF